MNRTATPVFFVLCVLCGSLCLAQTCKCDWCVNGLGGGDMSNTSFRCGATAGQTAAGQLTGASYWAYVGFWQSFQDTVGIKEEAHWPAQGPLVTRLYRPVPNPFRTAVGLRLTANGPAELAIYDQTGRIVRSWAVSCKLSAVSSVSWDGTDDRGRELAPGVYFCRLVVTGVGHDPAPMTEKLVLQR